MKSFIPYLLALTPLCHSFSLDTATDYWNYTTTSLADTTSQKCKTAYSAEIECDSLLADLVAAGEDRALLPEYDMDTFFHMCTATCHASVEKYISNVKESCSYPDDAALKVSLSRSSTLQDPDFTTVPVETIANLFLYTLMRSCAKVDGENCYAGQSGVYIPEYACGGHCATAWYWNRHTYPYYNWYFGEGEPSWLKNGPVNPYNNIMVEDWFDEDEEGWKNIVKCGLDFKNGTAPFDIGIEGVDAVSLEDATGTSTSAASAATPTKVVGGLDSSSTPTPTGAAGRIDVGKLGLIIAMAWGFSI